MELSEIKIQLLQRMESFGNYFSRQTGLTQSRQPDHSFESNLWKINFKVFLDDCERSGQQFASAKVKVILSENQKLKTQIAFLNHAGFCNSRELSDNLKVWFKRSGILIDKWSATLYFRILWMNLIFLQEIQKIYNKELWSFVVNSNFIKMNENLIIHWENKCNAMTSFVEERIDLLYYN